ncbi:MAG: hypothetical protein WCW27_03450 [Patescibacteria group bacterium]|jgi:hypothetical protein
MGKHDKDLKKDKKDEKKKKAKPDSAAGSAPVSAGDAINPAEQRQRFVGRAEQAVKDVNAARDAFKAASKELKDADTEDKIITAKENVELAKDTAKAALVELQKVIERAEQRFKSDLRDILDMTLITGFTIDNEQLIKQLDDLAKETERIYQAKMVGVVNAQEVARKGIPAEQIKDLDKRYVTNFKDGDVNWEIGGKAFAALDLPELGHAELTRSDFSGAASIGDSIAYNYIQPYEGTPALSAVPAEFTMLVTDHGVTIEYTAYGGRTVGPKPAPNPAAAVREYRNFQSEVTNFIKTEADKKVKQEKDEADLTSTIEKYLTDAHDEQIDLANNESLKLSLDDYLDSGSISESVSAGKSRTITLTKPYKDRAYSSTGAYFKIVIEPNKPAAVEYKVADSAKAQKLKANDAGVLQSIFNDKFVKETEKFCTEKKAKLETAAAKAALEAEAKKLVDSPVAADEWNLPGVGVIGKEIPEYLALGKAKEDKKDTEINYTLTRDYTVNPTTKAKYADKPAVFKLHVDKDKTVVTYQLEEGGAEITVDVKDPADIKKAHDGFIAAIETSCAAKKFTDQPNTKELLNTVRMETAKRDEAKDKYAVMKNLEAELAKGGDLKKYIEKLISALANKDAGKAGTVLKLDAAELKNLADHIGLAETDAQLMFLMQDQQVYEQARADQQTAVPKSFWRTAGKIGTIAGVGIGAGLAATTLAVAMPAFAVGAAGALAARMVFNLHEHFRDKKGAVKQEKGIRSELEKTDSDKYKQCVNDVLARIAVAVEQKVKTKRDGTVPLEVSIENTTKQYVAAKDKDKGAFKTGLDHLISQRANQIERGSLDQLAKRYGIANYEAIRDDYDANPTDKNKKDAWEKMIKPIEQMAEAVKKLYLVEAGNDLFEADMQHNQPGKMAKALDNSWVKRVANVLTLGVGKNTTTEKSIQAFLFAGVGIATRYVPGLRVYTGALAGGKLGMMLGEKVGTKRASAVMGAEYASAITAKELHDIDKVTSPKELSLKLAQVREQLNNPKYVKAQTNEQGQRSIEYVRLQTEAQRLEELLVNDARMSLGLATQQNDHIVEHYEKQKQFDHVKLGYKVAGGVAGAALGAIGMHELNEWLAQRATAQTESNFQKQWAKDRQEIIDRPFTNEQIQRAAAAVREDLSRAQEAGTLTPDHTAPMVKIEDEITGTSGKDFESRSLLHLIRQNAKELGYDKSSDISESAWVKKEFANAMQELKSKGQWYNLTHEGDKVVANVGSDGQAHYSFEAGDQAPAVDLPHGHGVGHGAGNSVEPAGARADLNPHGIEQALTSEQQWAHTQTDMLQHPERFHGVDYHFPAVGTNPGTSMEGLETDLYVSSDYEPFDEPLRQVTNPITHQPEYFYVHNNDGVAEVISVKPGTADWDKIVAPYNNGLKYNDVDLSHYGEPLSGKFVPPEMRVGAIKDIIAQEQQVKQMQDMLADYKAQRAPAETIWQAKQLLKQVEDSFSTCKGRYEHGVYFKEEVIGKMAQIDISTKVAGVEPIHVSASNSVGQIKEAVAEGMHRAMDKISGVLKPHYPVAEIAGHHGEPLLHFSLGFERNSGLLAQAQRWVDVAQDISKHASAGDPAAKEALSVIQHALERGLLPHKVEFDGKDILNATLQG